MNKVYYSVWVTIPFSMKYDALEMGYKLEKFVKRGSDSSGAGFGNRDMDWYFKVRKEADTFKTKIKSFFKKNSLKGEVGISKYEDEDIDII